ncbi:MAG: FAD-dependent monooxygenase, partial [Burkholderiales bacterium]|nr:FAD-dependent monooxygenase [Burkholderiales bacterium]
MHAIEPASTYDVAVIGCGPVGITLAGLLGREGLRVAVFDRATEVYAQPRAVGFDHDAMRLFQRIGAAEALAPHVTDFRNTVYRGADGQVIQRVRRVDPPYPYTWAPNYTCDQPGVEAVLRQTVGAMPSVHFGLGTELLTLATREEGVSLMLRDAHGQHRACEARWVVGCDGASSTVRRLSGLKLRSHDYDEPWIVVDLKVGDAALSRLPDTNVQYCEPERPCTYIVCPGNHRRWEFMLMPDEPREGALDPARLWTLLQRWLQPGEAELWRAAAYRFHALVADDWRAGRVLLAGDAAHQT